MARTPPLLFSNGGLTFAGLLDAFNTRAVLIDTARNVAAVHTLESGEIYEIVTATPPVPSAGRVHTFARDNGAGLVQIVALFPSGSIQVLATDPTPNTAPPPAPVWAPDFHVSPTGGTGAGSAADPWSMTYACAGAGGAVVAGTKIQIEDGTYAGTFTWVVNGTYANPVVLRGRPGGRATVDLGGNFTVQGSHTWFWGFELTQSTYVGSIFGVFMDYLGLHEGHRFINMVVRDTATGFYIAHGGALETEIYGCLIYHNGDAFTDHGVYAHTMDASTGTLKISDNIVFNNWGYGLHLYAHDGSKTLRNILAQGNILFNSSSIAAGDEGADLLLGGALDAGGPVVNGIVRDNVVYHVHPDRGAVQIGYFYGPVNTSVIFERNYVYGLAELFDFAAATIADNVMLAHGSGPFWGDGYVATVRGAWGTRGDVGGHTYTNNTVCGDAADNIFGYGAAGDPNPTYPAGSLTYAAWAAATGKALTVLGTPKPDLVFVRPNAYEPGRGNIAIVNWSGTPSISVDLTSVLTVGQAYKIVNAQAFYGTPVLSGTYAGGSVSLPMAGISAPVPVTRPGVVTGPTTGPTFQAFVVLPVYA